MPTLGVFAEFETRGRITRYPAGSPLQQSRVFLVELDQLDQVLDSDVGERLNTVLSTP